jgi:hypothetical protein
MESALVYLSDIIQKTNNTNLLPARAAGSFLITFKKYSHEIAMTDKTTKKMKIAFMAYSM